MSQAKGSGGGGVLARRYRLGPIEESAQFVVGYFTEVGPQAQDGVADLHDRMVQLQARLSTTLWLVVAKVEEAFRDSGSHGLSQRLQLAPVAGDRIQSE
nr:hypothetical protein [Mycobacterium riyadhense]